MLDFRTDTFLTVCETMNFTEAAKRLHITPVSYTHLNAMKEITKETLLKAMKSRDAGEHPVFRECEFKDMDLSGMDLHNMDFTLSSFQNVNLERVKMCIRDRYKFICYCRYIN